LFFGEVGTDLDFHGVSNGLFHSFSNHGRIVYMRTKNFLTVSVLASVGALCVVPSASAAKPATAVRLQDAVKQTVASKTLAFGVSIKMDIQSGGQTMSGVISGTGVSDTANKASSFSMDMGSFMKSVAKQSGKPLPPQFDEPGALVLQTVSSGGKVWMNFPLLALATKTVTTKPWLLLDAAKLGLDAGDVAASQGIDPTQGLDMMVGLAAGAKPSGGEVLNGVPTTKFTATLTAEALTKNLPAAQAADVTKLMGGAQNVPASVWVDEQNRVRRLDVTFTVGQGTNKAVSTASYTFSKFNEPVSIVAPAANLVTTSGPLVDMIVNAAKAKKGLAAPGN
jgi:LppX_LprAFG lipoprotein